jgi:hypothetical protein
MTHSGAPYQQKLNVNDTRVVGRAVLCTPIGNVKG